MSRWEKYKSEFLSLYEEEANKIEDVILKNIVVKNQHKLFILDVYMCNGKKYEVELVPLFAR